VRLPVATSTSPMLARSYQVLPPKIGSMSNWS
jgi:hypothetical protein